MREATRPTVPLYAVFPREQAQRATLARRMARNRPDVEGLLVTYSPRQWGRDWQHGQDHLDRIVGEGPTALAVDPGDGLASVMTWLLVVSSRYAENSNFTGMLLNLEGQDFKDAADLWCYVNTVPLLVSSYTNPHNVHYLKSVHPDRVMQIDERYWRDVFAPVSDAWRPVFESSVDLVGRVLPQRARSGRVSPRRHE